jgi:PAS domain-containing protein
MPVEEKTEAMTEIYQSLLSEEQPGILRFGGARMAMLDIEAGFWGLRRQMEALVGPRLTDSVLQQAGANGGASFARAFAGSAGDAQALRDCIAAYQAAGFGQFEIETLQWPFGYAQDRPIGRALVRAHQAFEAWTMQQHDQAPKSPVCAYTAGVLVGFVNALAGRHDVVCIERACQAQGAASCLFELLPADIAGDAPVIAFAPDPALGRQINLLEILFDRMPMGIAVFDRDLRIRRFNPTWAEFVTRYSAVSPAQIVPGLAFFELVPDIEAAARPGFERVLLGETVRQDAFRLDVGGIVSYWDAVNSPLTEGGRVVGIVHVTTDVTERVEARLNLERRVEERTRELATLLQVSHDVNSTLELQPLLELILDQLKKVVDYSGASILTLEGEDLAVRAYRGPIPGDEARRICFPLAGALVNREVIRQQAPLLIADVRGDAPLARKFR